METQFRCKCGNPMPSINQKCDACGSLGPHDFVNRTESAAGASAGPAAGRRESFTPSAGGFVDAGPVDIADEAPSRMRGSREDDEDKFPAGIRRRSPMLDHIEDMDRLEEKEYKKGKRRDEDEDFEAEYEDESDEEEEEEEQPERSKGGSLTTIIVSVILVILLILLAMYVINNYDTITKWLASPTVPEVFKPSQ